MKNLWNKGRKLIPAGALAVMTVVAVQSYDVPTLPEVEAYEEVTTRQVQVTEEKKTEVTTEEQKEKEESGSLNDGIYYGIGNGFAGDITVGVAIQDKKIKAALITQAVDDAPFLEKASAVLEQVVSRQSANVDIVSGATYSSKGIISAVSQALANSRSGNSTIYTGSNQRTTTTTNTDSEETKPKTTYKNGVYSVTVACSPDENEQFPEYLLSMDITIKKNKITEIKNIKGSGDNYLSMNDSYIKKAVEGTDTQKGVIEQITAKGKATKIDAVSGATCTSKSIIKACKLALESVKKKDTNKQNQTITEATTQQTVTTEQQIVTTEVNTMEEIPAENTIYTNGKYYVTPICFPDDAEDFDQYTIGMYVTIFNDRITAIEEIKGIGDYDKSNDYYLNRAINGTTKYKGVVSQILERGNVEEIDVVSGATCCVNAIVNGCKSALEQAKKTETVTESSIETTQVGQ